MSAVDATFAWAIRKKKPMDLMGTVVIHNKDKDVTHGYIHGNEIIRVMKQGTFIRTMGYHTPTTTNRLKAVIPSVKYEHGKVVCNHKEVDSDHWVKVLDKPVWEVV